MIGLILTTLATTDLTALGVYGTIGGAGAANLGALGFIYRSIAAERKERSEKIDQVYSHINTHFARRETIEAHLAAIKQAATDQTEMLRAFIDAQASLARSQGRLETQLEMLERNRT
jgi:prephenate dehydratase